MNVIINTDGGVRTGGVNGPTGGKTGRAAIAAVIKDDEGNTLFKEGQILDGRDWTVNEAEYCAVIFGLRKARELGATSVIVRSDSQLVTYQLLGSWQCKQSHLKVYLDEVLAEAEHFETVRFTWIKRDFNQHADQIARKLLDDQPQS